MKQLLYFLGMVLAGIFGYIAEPDLRANLTGVHPTKTVTEDAATVPTPAPALPTIDFSKLAPSQLPEKVVAKTEVKVADSDSGLIMTIPAGSHLKLVRIQNADAYLSPGSGPYIGRIPISDTDLLEQLAANPPAAVSATPAPAPEPAKTPEVAAAVEPAKEIEVLAPQPEAPAAPPASDTPAPVAEGSTDIVTAMQNSVKAGQVKEFTFSQVLDWKADADEAVDGQSYQTGIASYKAETIFGVKTIQAKALLKDGKVQRWVWLKSGMEIK